MMRELEYPFNPEEILRKKNRLKKELLQECTKGCIQKRIAILGGQTTETIKTVIELFLLNYGIKPSFYESEYNKYYEDGMFENHELKNFAPDIIYICTCNRNIMEYPSLSDSRSEVELKINQLYNKFEELWRRLTEVYCCPIIQNNFEYPSFRLLGNKDASDYRGRVNFITQINCKFYKYAQSTDNFYICDINYLSANYGLEKWSDSFYWHMYKYGVAVPAIPYLSFNVANIIKAIYGKNKKAFSLDLDNTLWGGIIGDDGADNIEIGQETPVSQVYSEFQEYIKLHKQLGVLLTINSKNDLDNAISGLKRVDCILKEEDFVNIKANWNPKSENLLKAATELGLLPDSFVFVDDNPAERAIVKAQIDGVAVPEIESAENYINIIDKSGFFETVSLSKDDFQRTEMYIENVKRTEFQANFLNYEDYLKSLEMEGEINNFKSEYFSRIAQLTNKSNQFNLTTKRYSQSDIEAIAFNEKYLTLYGKLADRFGDNGVVSVIIGHIDEENQKKLHIELWLMSCRVLKRNMEYAMMDELVKQAKAKGITDIIGYYYPTAKNGMVKEFYEQQGFEKIDEDENGNTIWKISLEGEYESKQNVIKMKE